MTFLDHKLNQVCAGLLVFSIELGEGETYSDVQNAVIAEDGSAISMDGHEFSIGGYTYRVLKVVYDTVNKTWLALCFELIQPEEATL